MSIVPVLVALLVFSVIVFVHELGHYLLAKRGGIKVEEFAIGMGPKIIGKQIGETLYSIRVFPIGGFCKMLGEEENSSEEKAFCNKSVWVRMSVVVAGPLMNFVFALVAVFIVSSISGISNTQISKIVPNSKAEQVGLRPGDVVLAVDGKRTRIMEDIHLELFDKKGNIVLTILRDGNKKNFVIPLGVTKDGTQEKIGFTSDVVKVGIWDTVKYSYYKMVFYIKLTVVSLEKMITGKVKSNQIAGPLGIINIIGDTYKESIKESIIFTFVNLLSFAAMLSANLGIVNLVPFPALDGGRLAFMIVEAVRKKPVDSNKENMVHVVGFVLLMVLMVAVLYNDIVRMFVK